MNNQMTCLTFPGIISFIVINYLSLNNLFLSVVAPEPQFKF